MSKPRFNPGASSGTRAVADDETKQEIDRQHALLLANLDKKQLRGNATVEDYRHYRQASSLVQNEKRGRYQIKTQRNELLNDLHKVRSSYTGHYDDSKTPFENIQQALRTKSQTPAKNSRASAPNLYSMRRCRSNEVLRPSTSLGSPGPSCNPSSAKTLRPKTASPSVAKSKPKKVNTCSTEISSKKDKSL